MSYLKKDEASKGFDRGLTVLSDTNLLNGVRRQSTSTLLYSFPATSQTTSLQWQSQKLRIGRPVKEFQP
jgi:hypothetical protein